MVLAAVLLTALGILGIAGLGDRTPGGVPTVAPAPGGEDVQGLPDPFAWDPEREDEFVRRAATGTSHLLYTLSPGGAAESAQRVERWRPQIEAAARAAGVNPDTLEGLVFLESAGRDDAVTPNGIEGAVGLTQILAGTATDLLDMKVDPAGARRIGRSLRRATRAGDSALIGRLRARRRAIDERFDPPKALAAAARYLTIAKRELGRDDLAIVSYHMGIGNLQTALRLYGEDDISYARLYFDSTPLQHAEAYRKLAALGDDSATYLWRVAAAGEIMRQYRADPAQLDRSAALQTAKNSAEEVLHPKAQTERFATPSALRAAYADQRIAALRRATLAKYGLALDPGMGELAPRLGGRRSTYRGLRPAALALLSYLGAGVKSISGSDGRLVVTSSVRDARYQRLLLSRNREATPNYSLHTTGWAFDILRTYASRAQALAFEFMLERLQAHDLIAWVREPAAIHVTVSSDAGRLAAVLTP
jgi:hypothetical protein